MSESSFNGPISVAVIGAGAFGKNHARIYRELANAGESLKLAGIVDTNTERAGQVAQEFGCPAATSVDDLLSNTQVHAASVAVPTVAHAKISCQLMKAGIDVLIEKPLASSLAEADEIVKTA